MKSLKPLFWYGMMRARDAQRLKDLNTIQAVLEQYINDGNTPTLCQASAPCHSDTNAGTSPNVCGTGNWTGISFCNWSKTFPTDPASGSTRNCITGVGSGTQANCKMRYRLIFTGSNYEISSMLESTLNAGKAANDGGTVASLIQIYSATELTNTGGAGFTVAGGTALSN